MEYRRSIFAGIVMNVELLISRDLKEKIFEYNRKIAEQSAKADDVDVLVNAMLGLPPGQVKKVFKEDVVAVLKKYGYIKG